MGLRFSWKVHLAAFLIIIDVVFVIGFILPTYLLSFIRNGSRLTSGPVVLRRRTHMMLRVAAVPLLAAAILLYWP